MAPVEEGTFVNDQILQGELEYELPPIGTSHGQAVWRGVSEWRCSEKEMPYLYRY